MAVTPWRNAGAAPERRSPVIEASRPWRHVVLIDLVHSVGQDGVDVKTVNIHEAKTHFSRLVAAASEGEEIVIAKAGRPLAKLVRIPATGKKRPLGTARGQIVYHRPLKVPLPKQLRKAFGA